MGLSSSILTLSLALLVGLYAGININLSSHHHVSSVPDSSPSSFRGPSSNKETERQLKEVKMYQSEAEQWKSKAIQLEKDLASSQNKIHDLEGSCSKPNNKDDDKNQIQQRQAVSSTAAISQSNPHPMCQSLLPNPAPSAMATWNQHVPQILDATRVPNDRKWQFHDFTAQLLQIISPRLPRSVKTIPYDWRPVEQAMTVAWERYRYLQLPPAERRNVANPPRPLKILVMVSTCIQH